MPGTSNPAATPFRRIVRIGLVLAWSALIFVASDQPDLRVSSDDALDLVLRKCAHMLVFGVLLVLIAHLLRGEGIRARSAIGAAWIATLAYAVSDEWHQTFVPGRAGQPSDVMIDMIGATVAALLLHRTWRDRTDHSPEEPSP